MYKLVDRFKRNAQKRFEENIAKPSTGNSKRGKNVIKFLIFFKIVENKTFISSILTNVKVAVKLKFC